MTRGSNIVFRLTVNDRVICSCFDNPPGCLGLSGDTLVRPAPVISCCLLLVFIPICFIALSRPRKESNVHTRATLRSLLTVIAPTCSLWPSRYVKLVSILRSHVDLPLAMVIEDTTDGIIEFRNPIDDLEDLIGSGITINGHTIRVSIGWKWWISCFEWWMLAKSKSDYPPSCPPGDLSMLSVGLSDSMAAASSRSLNLCLSQFSPTSSTSCPLLCLDHLPHGLIPTLNAGCKATLEFTTFSPSLRTFSTAQIVSTVLFIISESPPRRPRTLISVLKQLSASYNPSVVVDSVSNVSVNYEHALRHAYWSFSREQKVREMWIKSMGIKAWRREMFLVALEAALLRRGWIERWAIQVTAK